MPLPGEFIEAKIVLSERFLQPRKISEVHGVGVGKAGTNVFHLRIYVTNLNAQGLPQKLADVLKLDSPPALPSFKLGSVFASQFPTMPWLEDMTVDVIQSPRARIGATPVTTEDNDPPERTDKDCNYKSSLNPLPAGVSVWRNGSTEKGTIGYFCKVSGSTAKYLLSCNHVLVPPANLASSKGTVKIMRNGNTGTVEIGKLYDFIKLTHIDPAPFPNTNWGPSLVNRVDAALATMNTTVDSSTTALVISPSITGGVKMKTMVAPEYGMIVSKHGLASCWTGAGEVDDTFCDFAVLNDATPQWEFLFVDQFRIVKKNAAGKVVRFAKRGDSGSLIFTVDEKAKPPVNQAVGLLFAVGNKFVSLARIDNIASAGDIEFTLATPITKVLEELSNVTGKTVSLINVTPPQAAAA